jgi:hypothetical protein
MEHSFLDKVNVAQLTMHGTTRPVHLILLDLIAIVLFAEEFRS